MEHLSTFQKLLVLAVFLASFLFMGLVARGAEPPKTFRYSGMWVSTSRPMDGTMECIVTPVGKNRKGEVQLDCRFWGVWQGVAFEYTARCAGKDRNKLVGVANIDGAPYDWAASISNKEFNCNFQGRYLGSFRMGRVK